MKKSKDNKKALEEIFLNQEFERLDEFSNAKEWDKLNCEEKTLLSELFLMKGEKQLAEGSDLAKDSFRAANQLAPDDSKVLYRQAMAFSNQTQNLFCLKTACKLFGSSLRLKPDYFDAWHGWGNTLVMMGSVNQDFQMLSKALTKYEKAEEFSKDLPQEKLAAFYRDYGLCWYALGQLSGEPQDFKQAVKFFLKCTKLGLNTAQFWNDYGNAVNELSQLMNKSKMIIEAIEMYWRAIKLSPKFYPGWYNLATTLKVLYQIHPQEAYYVFANESFDQATKIEPHNASLWIKWGELQALRGRVQADIENIKDGCRKFEIADICEPNHALILSAWGEALLIMGSWTEDLGCLKEALNKFHKSLEIQQDIPKVWFLYGSCLNELGRYYSDEKYFFDAIDKYQIGLQKDPKEPVLWYGMGLSFLTLGQMQEDESLIYEASQYFMRSVELGGDQIPKLWNDWGLALMKLANITDERKHLESAVKKFEEALKRSEKGGGQDPNAIDWLYNLGCAYEFLGDYEEDTILYKKALQIFQRVLEADPSFHAVYFNLACIYSRMGEVTCEVDLFFEANKYFEKVLQEDPEDDQAWNEWGVSFVNIAELTKEPLRQDASLKFYKEAEKKFVQSAGLGNIAAAYHMACLFSLTGNLEASIHFLEKCDEYGALPPLDDLLHDEWLQSVRSTPQFLQFLSEIEKKDYQ